MFLFHVADSQSTEKHLMLAIIFGPSGAGKSALIDELTEVHGFRRLQTVTTREAREDDDRRHATQQEFDALVARQELIATSPAYGNNYGLVRSMVDVALARSAPVYLVDFSLDNQADLQALNGFKTCFLILPPSEDALRERLEAEGRGSRVEASLAEYRRSLKEQMAGGFRRVVQHVVVNDDLASTALEIAELIRRDMARASKASPASPPRGQLIDGDIRLELNKGNLLEAGTWDASLLRHASYSMRIGGEAHVYPPGVAADGRRVAEVRRFGPGHQVDIHPGESALVRSIESLRLPANVQGFVFPRGLFVASALLMGASYLDPGFSGHFLFPITNTSDNVVRLPHGLEVARLVFVELHEPVQRVYTSADATSLSTELDAFTSFPPLTTGSAAETETAELLGRLRGGAGTGVETAELLMRQQRRLNLSIFGIALWGLLLVVADGTNASRIFDVSSQGLLNFMNGVSASIVAAVLVTLTSWLLRRKRRASGAR
jgi:deoxycytidine triphosphate deaminase